MFGDQETKPVDVITFEAFRHEGQHIEVGTLIKQMPAELAMELTGIGRVRAATKENVAAARAAAAAKEASATAAAASQAPAQAQADMAAAIATAVASALAAAGIGKTTAPA